jgi:histidinol phosphatase-like enzyme (inositol monophosphatase family)
MVTREKLIPKTELTLTLFEHELDVCRSAALRAGEVALRYRERGIGYDSKSDESPVTAADRECEQIFALAFEGAFPDDGLLGEEGALKPSRSGRRWIIDPIDGTRDYVRGIPVWAHLIGLEQEGEVVAGVAHFPGRGETYFASRGSGAFCNDIPIHISKITSAEQAVLCLTGINYFPQYPFSSELINWTQPFWSVRCFGGCLDAMMVARGEAEIWIEGQVKPWDLAAPKIIVEEAGARFFDFKGNNTISGGNAVVAVPALADQVLRFLKR